MNRKRAKFWGRNERELNVKTKKSEREKKKKKKNLKFQDFSF